MTTIEESIEEEEKGGDDSQNNDFISLVNFTFLMAILPVKSPCTLTIIARGALLVLLVIAGHGGCCQILVI